MDDKAAFEEALRAVLSKLVAVKPSACVEPPRASKLARCGSVASYCANFGCRAVRVVATSTGRGLEATRRIDADEFVFAERPVLKIDDRGDKSENAAAFAAAARCRCDAPLTSLLRDMCRDTDGDEVAGAYVSNAFEMDEEMGVFPMTAMMNHSCGDHNCAFMVDGDVLFVQATRPVEAGEALTLCYVAALGDVRSTRARRAELRESFNFLCACRRCAADDGAPAPPPARKKRRRAAA